jgi:hypothetical protein
MKKIVKSLGLMVLTGALFFACAPAFEPPGAEKYDLRSALARDRYTTVDITDPTPNFILQLQPTDGKNVSIQTFTITTSTYKNGTADAAAQQNLDIDENGKIPGLSIKLVTAVPDYQRCTLGDAIQSYAAKKTGVNTVEISLALTESWINTNGFVVSIDSKTATFNGEKILNQDGDNLVAEGEEDDFAVTGAFLNSTPARTPFTNLTLGNSIEWVSRSTKLVNVSNGLIPIPSVIKSGKAYSPVNIKDTGSQYGNLIDTEALKTAFKVQKLAANGTWGPCTVTSTYHSKDENIDSIAWTTGDVEVKFDNLDGYDQIRYRIDNYYIKESGAGVAGFVHRASYDNGAKDRPNETVPHSGWTYAVVRTADKGTITDVSLPAVSAGAGSLSGVPGAYYIDVTLTVAPPLTNSTYWNYGTYDSNTPDHPEIPAGLTDADYRSNLKIFHNSGTSVTDTGRDLLDLSGFRFEKREPLKFRIYFPENFTKFSTGRLNIYVLPGLGLPVTVTGGGTQYLRPTGNNFLGGALATKTY